jgi:hypothetical protein
MAAKMNNRLVPNKETAMKRRIIYLSALLILTFLAVVAINLPGTAIAKLDTAASQDNSQQSQASRTVLTSKGYNLVLQPASAASSFTSGSGQQSSPKAFNNTLQGGSYVLSQPGPLADGSGCCCKNYLSCINK